MKQLMVITDTLGQAFNKVALDIMDPVKRTPKENPIPFHDAGFIHQVLHHSTSGQKPPLSVLLFATLPVRIL